MSTPIMDEAAKALADPKAYTDEAGLHQALRHLRAHAPVSWVDVPNYAPFWAITKHADIMEIERANDVFTNSPRPVLVTREGDEQQAAVGIKTLIHMDDPQHRDFRAIGTNFFRPKAMRALKDRADELAAQFVDKMMAEGPECDFVQQVAVNYPLYMIMTLLGVPETDFASMLRWTQELFGSDDEEFQRGKSPEEQMTALLEMFQYFTELTANRRANPTDDLGSTIANATINGEPLSDIETVSYYAIIAAAGHDTSSASISGGMQALLEYPEQLARLRNDMTLMPLAVEEMIRWTTPVKEFMRTAQRDYEIRGVRIAAGESVLLSYVSGNRDEEVFSDPFQFDIGRDPNKHIAFGYGVHFCLGAALARLEINSFFSALLPRLRSVELAGPAAHVATTFVGGLKHLPIRYQLD
ncbi:cytochrome P450 [Mycolicibacterium sp. YH-1]|uniref:cytochrome P450 n=1 Tax=Mycolicibacterium sp. YH-1 TaxID=2908837 RepID=UPI001F4C2876|nr:cytochrome P450 [Mycolicibacterium sp. YH-1]UNB50622.1 cytochrome P450 [Mycolicibacterium sp. YH-1]